MIRRHPVLINFLLFLFCVFCAFSVRTWHYNTSVEILREIIRDDPESGKTPPPGFVRKLFPLYHRNFAPFTIESAMMFTYAQDVAQGRGVPASDPRLAGMEDLPPYAQMNMGLEWFLGWGWRLRSLLFHDPEPTADELCFQDVPGMAQWMSLQLRLWASLTTGFLFLWLLAMRCPRRLALFGALLHAVSLAAVARSTGQDFVRGEFCIPLYTACLALVWSLSARPRIWKYLLLFIASFLAFVTWDLCQMLFGVWCLCELLGYVLGFRITRARMAAWLVIACAILLNAAFVPFNVTYGLIRAPLVCVALPSLFAVCIVSLLRLPDRFRRPWFRLLPALILPILLYALWHATVNTPEYASNYEHFSRTMASKIKYLNMKPSDPDMLDYDSRIMWTPSMHSATWEIATSFFPSLYFGRKLNFTLFRFLFGDLPLTLTFFYLLLIGSTLFRAVRRTVAGALRIDILPILFTLGFTVGFVYIVRYHEFLILFLCASLPLLIRDWLRALRADPAKIDPAEAYTTIYRKPRLLKFIRGFLLFCCAVLLLWETGASFTGRRRYTGDIRFAETARLIAWFRSAKESVKGKVVAANFTVGPMLMAYAGTGITMNPQFGLKRIRDATEEYVHALYAPDESELLRYCEKYHADYVLYGVGSVQDMSPNSIRYIAGAKEVPPRSPANLMQYRPDALRWFCRIDPPPALRGLMNVYRLFQVITPEKRRKAAQLAFEARDAQGRGNWADADRLVREALSLDPASDIARDVYCSLHRRYPNPGLDGVE